MKLSNLISDLIFIGVVMLAGYFVYKMYQTVSGGATAVGNAADQWTPSALGNDLTNGVSAVINTIEGNADDASNQAINALYGAALPLPDAATNNGIYDSSPVD